MDNFEASVAIYPQYTLQRHCAKTPDSEIVVYVLMEGLNATRMHDSMWTTEGPRCSFVAKLV